MNTSTNFAMLFADVSGSTTLYEKLGDKQALAAIDGVLAELRKSIAMQHGHVVKTIGDEVMAVLPSADDAMLAACDMQNRIADIPPQQGVKLGIRIGFHYGPAIEENNDYFGDAVNTAARMAGLAKSGQIITSAVTIAALSQLLRQSTRDLDSTSVKGKQDEIRIYEVIWQDSDDLTTLASRDKPAGMPEQKLSLACGDCTLVLNPQRPHASLGREATNDLVVADKMASRVHCKIEHRRGQFFLIDQSTNGTYVQVSGDAEIMLKREQALLRGNGVISLGHPAAEAGGPIVKFDIRA